VHTKPADSGGIITHPDGALIGIVFGVLAGAAGWWAEGFVASALAALAVASLGAALMRWWDRRRSSQARPEGTEGR
jgi:membrane protein implicated in regulation of membrane protease activity